MTPAKVDALCQVAAWANKEADRPRRPAPSADPASDLQALAGLPFGG